MKVKNYPCLLTDEELKAEIEWLERKYWNVEFSSVKRLSDLHQELKRRQQTLPKTEGDL